MSDFEFAVDLLLAAGGCGGGGRKRRRTARSNAGRRGYHCCRKRRGRTAVPIAVHRWRRWALIMTIRYALGLRGQMLQAIKRLHTRRRVGT